jgi:opacity protein-like surface antigen
MKMKLLFSVVFVCTLLTTSYAQINKGSIWVGSNVSYSQSKDKPAQQAVDRKIKTISVLPSIGVAIKENIVLGIFAAYTDAHTDNDGYIVLRKEKTYGGGVFVRRYVPVFNRFYIFGEGRLGYNSYKGEEKWSFTSNTGTSTSKGWETGLTFTPGISYGITPGMQLEAGFKSLFDIRYQDSKITQNGYYNQNNRKKSFTAGVNLENASAFTIGFRFLINKKA